MFAFVSQVYDLDGTFTDEVQVTQLYKDTFDRFKNDNPDFSGAKIIFAPLRRVDTATMTKYLELASQLKVIHTDIACFYDNTVYKRIFFYCTNFTNFL